MCPDRRDVAAAGDPVVLGVFPVLAVEEPGWFKRWPINAVEASGVYGDFIWLGPRHVKRMHAAMGAEWVLRDPGLKGVDG